MKLDTLWGTVETRRLSTKLSRVHMLLAKDNLNLLPLFEWLKNSKVKSTEDFENENVKRSLKSILFQTEVKWSFQDSDIPCLIFKNSYPLKGNFEEAIRQYLNLFKIVMYSPEKFLEV